MVDNLTLDVKALALSAGILSGLCSFIIGIISVWSGVGLEFLNLVGWLHPGYSPTYFGIVIMTAWMFIYGLIGGAFFAFMYNLFAKNN